MQTACRAAQYHSRSVFEFPNLLPTQKQPGHPIIGQSVKTEFAKVAARRIAAGRVPAETADERTTGPSVVHLAAWREDHETHVLGAPSAPHPNGSSSPRDSVLLMRGAHRRGAAEAVAARIP